MAKSEETRPDVVWQLIRDGLRPTPAPWGFVVRNPVMRVIQPGQRIRVDLGVAANVPMNAWARGDIAEYVTVDQFVLPGKELSIVVENKSAHAALVLDNLEPLVNVHPLVFKGSAAVG